MKLRNSIILILLTFYIISGWSQKNKIISLYENGILSESKSLKKTSETEFINKKLVQLIEQGYLTLAIDSSLESLDSSKIYISKGEVYEKNNIKINFKNKGDEFYKDIFSDQKLIFKPLNFSKKILYWLEFMNNNGYPFATFEFKNSIVNNKDLRVICDLKEGPFVTIDSIYNPELSEKELKLIYKISRIKKGNAFNLSLIKGIPEKLKKTNYFSINKPVAYEFINNKASIYSYAKTNPVNNINGLVGIQPDDDGNVQLTGNLSFTFLNALKRGEMLHLNWRRMFNASQNLITSLSIPYLFKSDFELKGYLNMIKKDSSFFNIGAKANINYLINSNYSIGVLYDIIGSTNLLDEGYNSTSVNNFGFSFHRNNLNEIINPTSGYITDFEVSAGLKKTFLNENNIEKLLKTPNYFGVFKHSHFLRTSKRSTIKIGLNASTMVNENMFENELIRIGGYKNLRGFDEESIYVSSYFIGSFEMRYLIDEKSNVFLFTDLGITEKKTTDTNLKKSFNSVGLGTNLSLNNGFMTIIYALGRETNQAFLFRTGKIHIGFTSFF